MRQTESTDFPECGGKGYLQSGGKKLAHVKKTRPAEIGKDLYQGWVREAPRLNQTEGRRAGEWPTRQ